MELSLAKGRLSPAMLLLVLFIICLCSVPAVNDRLLTPSELRSSIAIGRLDACQKLSKLPRLRMRQLLHTRKCSKLRVDFLRSLALTFMMHGLHLSA